VCKYLQAGVLVRSWERRHDVTPAVHRFMASEEETEIRRWVTALGEAVRGSVAEGGSSRQDL
jgi:cis-zeatin O-glucosyltransferase